VVLRGGDEREYMYRGREGGRERERKREREREREREARF